MTKFRKKTFFYFQFYISKLISFNLGGLSPLESFLLENYLKQKNIGSNAKF